MLNKVILTLGLATFGAVFTAQAGPPLICRPFNIGTAQSLPWGSSVSAGWDDPDPSYNVRLLNADTLKLLNDSTPVLVRMETMRRAAIYGDKDHRVAAQLLSNLRTRAETGGTLALFDYGYFIETVKQMQWRYKEDITGGVDGSALVTKALSKQPGSADMHTAADLIAASRPK